MYRNRREAIRKQLKEKFGEENKEEKNETLLKEHLSTILRSVIQAITNEQFNNGRDANDKLILSDATLNAIETFRKEFAENQPKIITSGRRFRLETLQDLCEAYLHQATQWDYNYNKCALLEDAVLSFVLGYASKNDAQRFNQGLYYLQYKGEKFTRANATRDGVDFYLTLRGTSSDFALSGSCVDIIFGFARIRPVAFACEWLQNLCRTKTSNLQNLCSHTQNRKSIGV